MVPDIPILGQVGWKAYAAAQAKLFLSRVVASGLQSMESRPASMERSGSRYLNYWVSALLYALLTSSVNKQAQIWTKYLPQGSKIVWFHSLSGPLINNNMLAGKNQIGYMAETPALRSGDTVPCDMISVTGYDVG